MKITLKMECVPFIFFILVISCISTSVMRLESDEFRKNLPGYWIGGWELGSITGRTRLDIVKIDGNEVHLTGFSTGDGSSADTDDVYGRIEDSTLLLTWPGISCKEEFIMIRDNSNNLILKSHFDCEQGVRQGTSQLKKIDWK